MIPLLDDIFHMGNCAEDIVAIGEIKFSVDNGNEIAPENVT